MKKSRVSVLPPVIGVKLDLMNCFGGFALFSLLPVTLRDEQHTAGEL